MGDNEIIDVTTEKNPDTTKELILIEAEKDGLLIGKTFEDQKRLAATWHSSGMVPKSYKNPSSVLAGLQFAIGLGLAPSIASLRNIAVINGQPSIYGELPLELVRKSGELVDIVEYLIDKDKKRIEYVTDWEEIFAAICIVERKGFPKKKFTFTRFQAEKGIKGIKAIWEGYYDVMMKRKCRARALKDEFTDILGSRSIAEYDYDFAPDVPGMEKKMKDVTNSVTSDLELL